MGGGDPGGRLTLRSARSRCAGRAWRRLPGGHADGRSTGPGWVARRRVHRLPAAASGASRPDAAVWPARSGRRSGSDRRSARILLTVRTRRGRVRQGGIDWPYPERQCRHANDGGDRRCGGQALNIHFLVRLPDSHHADYQLPGWPSRIRTTATPNGDVVVSPLPTTTTLSSLWFKRTRRPNATAGYPRSAGSTAVSVSATEALLCRRRCCRIS